MVDPFTALEALSDVSTIATVPGALVAQSNVMNCAAVCDSTNEIAAGFEDPVMQQESHQIRSIAHAGLATGSTARPHLDFGVSSSTVQATPHSMGIASTTATTATTNTVRPGTPARGRSNLFTPKGP